jgi:CMP-N-acetylneuraminic acid synthetase
MIYALQTGRGESKGFKDKNIYPVLGRPLMTYALMAANHSKHIEKTYLTTDSKEIGRIGQEHEAEVIWRPDYLAADDSLHQDAIVHGYEYMVNELGLSVDIIVIILCNSATVTPEIIDKGIETLLADESIDSCVTVSKYNEYNPARSMRVENGRLKQTIDPSYFQDITCDRRSAGETYFYDGGASICRARCMNLDYGVPPYKWLGKNIVPLVQEGGLDVDNERGFVITEHWLRNQGFDETKTPYDK